MDFDAYSFRDGLIVDRNKIYLLGVEDSKAEKGSKKSIFFYYNDDDWNFVELDDRLVSFTLANLPQRRITAIAENGMAYMFGGGEVFREYIYKDLPAPHDLLAEVRAVAEGHAYAVGSGRVVHRKEGLDKWSKIDKTCEPKSIEKGADVAFLSIDGFAEDDIYAVGWDGEIWYYNGEKWQMKDSPTNVNLHKVRCCKDGYVYACCEAGIIVKGRDNSWEVIKQDITEEDFRGLAYFKEEVYLASNYFIYRVGKNGFKHVKFHYNVTTCSQLYATDDLMLSVGIKDVFLYDGNTWEKIV